MGRHYARHHQNFPFNIKENPQKFYITTNAPTSRFPKAHLRPLPDSELRNIFGVNMLAQFPNWITFSDDSESDASNKSEDQTPTTPDSERTLIRQQSLQLLKEQREKKASRTSRASSTSKTDRVRPASDHPSTAESLAEIGAALAGTSRSRPDPRYKAPSGSRTERTSGQETIGRGCKSRHHRIFSSSNDKPPETAESSRRPDTVERPIAIPADRTPLASNLLTVDDIKREMEED